MMEGNQMKSACRRVFFKKEHTEVVLEGLFYHLNNMSRSSPKWQATMQTWQLWSQACRGKRFVLEAETEDLIGRGGGDLIIKR
jgi:hypothetical protein